MSGANVAKLIERIDSIDSEKARKNVTILGAGMAGLVAAFELCRLGHNVTIIEAQDRVGGRVFTWNFKDSDNSYHELGAMRIPDSHSFTNYYIEKFDLKLRKFVSHHDRINSFYFFRGVLTTHEDWAVKLLPTLNLSPKELHILDQGRLPPIALLSVFGHAVEEIASDPASLKAIFGEGPMTPIVEKYDSQSLYDYLAEYLDTEDAIELAGAASGLEVWWDKAMTMFLRDELRKTWENLKEIIGGASMLPDAIFKSLNNKRKNFTIKKNKQVKEIHNRNGSVQIVIQDAPKRGEDVDEISSPLERLDADYVICTIPYSVLRRLKVSGLSAGKTKAIRNLSYASSVKVLFLCKERFWQNKYGIYGGGSQTDLINRQIYYPSDLLSDLCEAEVTSSSSKGVFSSFVLKNSDVETPIDDKRQGVLVGTYVWGRDARRLGLLSKKQRAQVVQDCVANIHPEIQEDGMIVDSASMNWDENPWAAGAFCFMRPNEMTVLYQDIISSEGNLFFAGEHCSLDQAWIEGAVSSALNSVKELVAK